MGPNFAKKSGLGLGSRLGAPRIVILLILVLVVFGLVDPAIAHLATGRISTIFTGGANLPAVTDHAHTLGLGRAV